MVHGNLRPFATAAPLSIPETHTIEHAAKTAWLSEWHDGIFAMLTACFDASGHVLQDSLLIAGFAASADDWIEFDLAWKRRLSEDGLTYFHMQAFAQSTKPFDVGWRDDESRRQKLLGDLYDIIFRHAYRKFGTAVDNSDLAVTIPESDRKEHSISSYGLAGRGVVDNVLVWVKREGLKFPEFVFENGDSGKGSLIDLLYEDGLPVPSFRPKRDTIKKHGLVEPAFTPLQAADILAYEYRLALENRNSAKLRWGYKRFHKMPGEIRKYSRNDLRRIASVKTKGELL